MLVTFKAMAHAKEWRMPVPENRKRRQQRHQRPWLAEKAASCTHEEGTNLKNNYHVVTMV